MPTIVICGVPGAGSSTVAKAIATLMGLKHYSVGDKVKSQETGKETERAIKWFKGEGAKKDVHKELDLEQIEVAKEGDVVIDSKLGIHFLKGIANLTVWLNCAPAIRAIRVAQRDRMMPEDARKVVDQKDRLERQTIMNVYGFDSFAQEKDADLVIDTTKLTQNEVVEKVMAKLKEKGIV